MRAQRVFAGDADSSASRLECAAASLRLRSRAFFLPLSIARKSGENVVFWRFDMSELSDVRRNRSCCLLALHRLESCSDVARG